MINPLERFDLTGLETFELTVNFFYGDTPEKCG